VDNGGELIRSLRMEKGLSLKELGEKADVNYVFLSKLERGLENPSEELVIKLAKALDYKGNINELVAKFGKVPESIKQLIIEDPSAVVELPAFFKSRRKKGK
jgi:transcriptional regulator with XRE-family HTH domain